MLVFYQKISLKKILSKNLHLYIYYGYILVLGSGGHNGCEIMQKTIKKINDFTLDRGG